MDDNNKLGYSLVSLTFIIAMWVAAFATYGGKGGLLVMLVLGTLTGLSSLTGMVPLAGPFLYWKLQHLASASFSGWFPEISSTWLTEVMFWGGFVSSVVLSLVATVAAISRLRDG